MKRLSLFWSEFWRNSLAVAAAAIAFIFLYIFKLGSLVSGINRFEHAQITQDITLKNLADNPVNAPYHVLSYVLEKLSSNSVLFLRLATIIFVAVAVVCFYVLLRYWTNQATATFGTLLFASSAWLLHFGRNGSALVTTVSVVALIVCGLWLEKTRKSKIALMAAVLVLGFSLYIPGMIIFVVLGAIWQRKTVAKQLDDVPALYKALCAAFLIVFSIPILIASVQDINVAKQLVGIPAILPSITTILKNIVHLPEALFWRAHLEPSIWLGTLPLLDIFVGAMFVIGLYSVSIENKLDRNRAIIGGLLMSGVLYAVNGSALLSIFMPFVLLVACIGIAYFLGQWLSVFPRNPVARFLGYAIITGCVVLSVGYNTTRYFIAWPNAKATKAVYRYNW